MKPYKLKHIPTGLYYQPRRHRGSNLSKRGRIYQTKINYLNLGYYNDGSPRKTITVSANKTTLIYKEFIDKFNWIEYSDGQYKSDTNINDWTKEEI